MAKCSWCLLIVTSSAFMSLVMGREGPETHYLLYSVNPGEGFNLRRDVYMRAATLVKELRKKEDWVLVLPPWPYLPHWKTSYVQENNLKWEKFFDLPSLNEYVPVIEFDDYLKKEGRSIDEVSIRVKTDTNTCTCTHTHTHTCLLYTSPSPRDATLSRMPSSA